MHASRFFLAFLLGLLLLPQATLARPGEEASEVRAQTESADDQESREDEARSGDRSGRGSGRAAGSICVRYDKEVKKFRDKVEETSSKVDTSFADRTKRLSSTTVSSDTVEARKKADSQLDSKLADLDEVVKTDDQRQAVTDFKAAIKAAVTARRAAVDEANSTYRAAVRQAVTARQAQLTAAKSTYRKQVEAAVAQAKASCTAGANPETVRQTLNTRLAAARATLQTARKSTPKVGASLAAAKQARKDAVEKANAAFKAAVAEAVSKLKAALQSGQSEEREDGSAESGDSTTTTPSGSGTQTPEEGSTTQSR